MTRAIPSAIVALVVVTVFGFQNYVGDRVQGGEMDRRDDLEGYCIHGWPLPFAKRKQVFSDTSQKISIWTPSQDVVEFRPSALVGNLTLMSVTVWGAVLLINRVLSSQRPLLQYSLQGMLVLICVFAMLVSLGLATWRSHRQHVMFLEASQGFGASVHILQGNPDWLFDFVTDPRWRIYDRIDYIDASTDLYAANDIGSPPRLPQVSPDTERYLLDLLLQSSVPTTDLRFLFLRGRTRFGNTHCRLLIKAKKLEQLDLSGTSVTDDGVLLLAESLPDLKYLAINDTAITDTAMRRLGSHSNLEGVECDDTLVSDDAKYRFSLTRSKLIAGERQ